MLLHIGLCNFTYMCILRINHGSLVCKDFQHKSLNALISNLWIYRYCTLYRVTNFLWKPVGRNHFKLVPQLRKWKINWCHHSTHRKSIDWAWKKWRGNPIKHRNHSATIAQKAIGCKIAETPDLPKDCLHCTGRETKLVRSRETPVCQLTQSGRVNKS